MLYATSPTGEKVSASPRGIGICPQCAVCLVPRCGKVNRWHWAHKSDNDCDPWSEPETEWHLAWKSLVRREACEVFVNGHRADILANDNLIIELQHSSISPEEIGEREACYDDMFWIFDAAEFVKNLSMRLKVNRANKEYFSFRWKHARKRQMFCQKPLFWDFGEDFDQKTYFDTTDCKSYYFPDRLFCVEKFYQGGVVSGWGFFVSMEAFLAEFLSDVLCEPVAG